MDQDDHGFDPLAPPPTHSHTHDTGYPYDQTVPNLESDEPHDMEYDHDSDPRNFHDDLPANFAREAAKSENQSQIHYEQDGNNFQPNSYQDERYTHDDDDEDDDDDDFRSQSHDEMEYEQKHGEMEYEQKHAEMEYEHRHGEMEPQRVVDEDSGVNPFDKADSLLVGQKNEYEEEERPILAGYNPGYAEDVQHQQQQEDEEKTFEQYHREKEEDEDEGVVAKEEIDDGRYEREAHPEQEHYDPFPQEAGVVGHLHPGDVRYDSEEEDDEAAEVRMVPKHGEDDDSDNENAATFEYNKMEEEETTEDNVSAGEEEEQEKQVPAAGIDNHAFDDNDDDAAEVIQRKVERVEDIKEDETEMDCQQPPATDFENDVQDTQLVCEPCVAAVHHDDVQHTPAFDDRVLDQQDLDASYGSDQFVEETRPAQDSEDEGCGGYPVTSQTYEEEIECQQAGRVESAPEIIAHPPATMEDEPVEKDSDDEKEPAEQDRFDDHADEIDRSRHVKTEIIVTGVEESGHYESEEREVVEHHHDDEVEEEQQGHFEKEHEEEFIERREEQHFECFEKEHEESVEKEVEEPKEHDEYLEKEEEDRDFQQKALEAENEFEASDDEYNMEKDEEEHEEDRKMDISDEKYVDEGKDEYLNEMLMTRAVRETTNDQPPMEQSKADTHIDNEDFDHAEEIESHKMVTDSLPRDEPCDDLSDEEGETAAPLPTDVVEAEQKPADLSAVGEEITSEAEKQPFDVYEEQLADNVGQSVEEIENTPLSEPPSSLGGEFELMTSHKEVERSFVDNIDEMASPETIPQRLPSPPKPENMSQFDPYAPASASSSPSPDDEDQLMVCKQPPQQQEQQQQSSEMEDGLYSDNNQVTPDGREESSEDLCLTAGEIEGETKFGVDGSAITTSTDQNVTDAFLASGEDEEESQTTDPSHGVDFAFEQQLQKEETLPQELEADDEDDDIINAGPATDYTTTTTTETETDEKSGADLDSSSLGQPGFDQGLEGGVTDNDNALMSMSMEGSFYDDGGDLMGGADGLNGDKTGEQLLIQSAITEVSEPTSSFSPHQDSVLRTEQHAFEEQLSQQHEAQSEDRMDDDQLVAPEEEIKVQTTHESFASIPSGFEEEPRVDASSANDFGFEENDAPSPQQNAFFDDHHDDEVASQQIVQNGGASEVSGVESLIDFTQTGATESAAPAESSPVDHFGLQNNQCNLGGSGFDDSSSVDNIGSVDNSSAFNGYHDSEIPKENHVHEEEAPALEHREEGGGKLEAVEDALSSAAAVPEVIPIPPVSSSVDATPVEPAKEEEPKKEEKEKKDKKKEVGKDKAAATKTSTAAKKTTTTTSTAKKTTTSTKKEASSKTTTSTTATTKSTRPPSARPTSVSTAKKTETSATSKTSSTAARTTSPRKPASATAAADKKATSPTKSSTTTTPGAPAKPLPRYAQPITPRKPRETSATSPTEAAPKKPATPKTTTAPRTRPASATTRTTSSTTTTSTLKSSTTTSTSSPRPKSSPTKLSNGTTPTSTDKRSTSPTKKYGINASPRTPASGAARATDKKDAKPSPRTGTTTSTTTGARSPTKTASPRTPTTPRAGAGSATKPTSGKKPDYSNVTSRIGSKDKMTHKPGGGNVKIESHKLKVEAKSRIGSLDNTSHKPAGGDKKVENGANGSSPV